MRNKTIPTLMLAALLAGAGSLWAKPVDEIAVVAGQDSMTQGELEDGIEAFFLGQGQKLPPPTSPAYAKARVAVLQSFIEEVALAQEADDEKIEVPDAEVDHAVDQQVDSMKKGFQGNDEAFNQALAAQGIDADTLRQELRSQLVRRLKAQHMLHQKQADLPDSAAVFDDQAKQYYAQHPDDFNQAHFAIILFRANTGTGSDYVKSVKAEAQQVLAEIKGGADFAVEAKKHSEDTGSADKGGDVGTVSKSALEPHLAKGVFQVPVGGVGLVQGVDGFYIIKVFSRDQADYASVASQIKDQLRKGNQDQALQDWVEGLKKKLYVKYSKNLASASAQPLPYDSLAVAAAPVSVSSPLGGVSQASSAPVSGNIPPSLQGPSVASDTVTEAAAPVYSPLPSEGNLTLDLNLSPWFFGTSDLAQNYPKGTNVGQGFPLGLDFDFGAELSIDPQLQIGAQLQAMDKFSPSVTDGGGTAGSWEENAVGLVLGPKFLMPLADGLNVDLYAQGGYFFLFGSAVKFSGANSGTLYLDGGNLGGQVGLDLEIFLDDEKTWTLDLGAAYRRLLINPTVTGDVAGYSLPGYQVDFSGVKTLLGFRFYVDKD